MSIPLAGMAPLSANLFGPFDPSTIASRTDFYDSLMNRIQQSHPNDGPRGPIDDIPITFKQYADWARDHPEKLAEQLQQVVFDMKDPIFRIFIPQQTPKSVHQWSFVDLTTPFVFEPNSMKAPTRRVHLRTKHQRQHSTFTGLGFRFDKHYLDTPDGPSDFKRINNHVISLMICYFQIMAYRQFFYTVSYYQTPQQLWLGDRFPTSLDMAVNAWRNEHGVFNKDLGYIKNAVQRYQAVFRQTNNSIVGGGKMIVTADFVNYLTAKTAAARSGVFAGTAEALVNRNNPMSVPTIMGVEIVQAPLTSLQLHDDMAEYLMYTVDSKGSMWRFPVNNYIDNVPPEKFEYDAMTTVKTYSYDTDRHDDHNFLTFLENCQEFNRLDGGRAAGSRAGEINYELLIQFFKDESGFDFTMQVPTRSNVRNAFSKANVAIDSKNEFDRMRDLHQFLYIKDRTRMHEAYPVRCWGEVDRYHMPAEKLVYYYKNLERRIFDVLTAAELDNFRLGLKVMDYMYSAAATSVEPQLAAIGGGGGAAAYFINQYGFRYVAGAGTGADFTANPTDIGGLGSIVAFLSILNNESPFSGNTAIGGNRNSRLTFNGTSLTTVARGYINALQKIVKRFVQLTNNHIGVDISLLPTYYDLTAATRLTPEFQRLIVFHHLIIRPEHIPVIDTTVAANRVLTIFAKANEAVTLAAGAVAGMGRAKYTNADATNLGITQHEALNAKDINTSIINSYLFGSRGGRMAAFLQANFDREHATFPYSAAYAAVVPAHPPRTKVIDRLVEHRERLENLGVDEIHPVSLQHIVHDLYQNSAFRSGWDDSFTRPDTMAIAQRAFLLDMIDLKEFEQQRETNRPQPLSGLVLRGDETQLMMSVPIIAAGAVGFFYYDKDFKFTSFDPNTQTYVVQMYAQFAPVVADWTKFFIAENAFGGRALGGKGRFYVNELQKINITKSPDDDEAWNLIIRRIGHGAELGSYCCVPVLQSLKSGLQRVYRTWVDRRGRVFAGDFAGRYTNAEAFQATDNFQYENSAFANFCYQFPTQMQPVEVTTPGYSFMDKKKYTAINNICCETTTIVFDYYKPTRHTRIGSSHFWGEQEPGSFAIETSLVGPTHLNSTTKLQADKRVIKKMKMLGEINADYTPDD